MTYLNSYLIPISFEGLKDLKEHCSFASSFKAVHLLQAGVPPNSLLSIIPCTRTSTGFTIDFIRAQLLDYLDRPLSALKEIEVIM